MKIKNSQILLSFIVIVLVTIIIYKLIEQKKAVAELSQKLSEQDLKLNRLINFYDNLLSNSSPANLVEGEPRNPIGFKMNKN
jgi:hypothetical protein